jgi:FtsZ-binding cell division protein ZapB
MEDNNKELSIEILKYIESYFDNKKQTELTGQITLLELEIDRLSRKNKELTTLVDALQYKITYQNKENERLKSDNDYFKHLLSF